MPRNYVDVKVSVWNRLYFDEGTDMKTIVENIELNQGIIGLSDCQGYSEECETLLDTEEVLHIDKNGGQATIEVYAEEKMIWRNADE